MIMICYQEVVMSIRLFYKARCLKITVSLAELLGQVCCKALLIRDCSKQTCRQEMMMMWSKLIQMSFKKVLISTQICVSFNKMVKFMIIPDKILI